MNSEFDFGIPMSEFREILNANDTPGEWNSSQCSWGSTPPGSPRASASLPPPSLSVLPATPNLNPVPATPFPNQVNRTESISARTVASWLNDVDPPHVSTDFQYYMLLSKSKYFLYHFYM